MTNVLRLLRNKLSRLLFGDIYHKIEYLGNNLETKLNAISTHNEIYFYNLFKQENETFEEARNRFFLSMKTIDDVTKLKQEGNCIILKEFSRICINNNLDYSIIGGFLIGIVRHKSFVPWDDDLDVMMPFSDYLKLKEIIKDHNELKIIEMYSPKTGCVLPKIIFKHHRNIWYLDIFIYVPCNIGESECRNIYLKSKKNLIKATKRIKGLSEDIYSDEEDPNVIFQLENIFNSKSKIYNKSIYKQTTNRINGFVRALGICDYESFFYIDYSDFYPLHTLNFRDFKIRIFNNYKNVLIKGFGNFYRLPYDINCCQHYNVFLSKEELKKHYYFLANIEKNL